MTVKVRGTNEAVLRYLPGKRSRELQVHLCGKPCSHRMWSDSMLHCDRLRWQDYDLLSWSRNLETSVREDERDDMEELRREAEKRGKGRGDPGTTEDLEGLLKRREI